MTDTTAEVSREELHYRNIDLRGYRRSDGLFEVVGRVKDSKPIEFTPPPGARLTGPNESIHDMGVCIVFDSELLIVDISTFTDASPYTHCGGGGDMLRNLIGLRMVGGFGAELRKRLTREGTCTHLVELLLPMATAAFQSIAPLRHGAPDPLDANGRPLKIDSCYAYSAKHNVVMRRWPNFYTGDRASEATTGATSVKPG